MNDAELLDVIERCVKLGYRADVEHFDFNAYKVGVIQHNGEVIVVLRNDVKDQTFVVFHKTIFIC